MKTYARACAKINLDAIESNVEQMKANLKEGTRMLTVLKADGCGHGALPVAHLLEEKEYLWGFAVATLDEAMVLRKDGVKKPVLVLGCIFPEQRAEAISHEIRQTVYTVKMAEEISHLAQEMGKDAYVHVKLDTGMSRLGFPAREESVEQIRQIAGLPGLKAEGMFTHFAKADETDKTFTNRQIEAYCFVRRRLEEEGVTFPIYHCSNSAAIIDMPEANMDMVRAGIAIYGLYPSEEVKKEAVKLTPAMEWISHVAHVKWVEAGTPVSYGGTFVTERPTRIATVPIGYADGYPRSLSNKGYVLIRGQKAPILGRVCMDQMMVDATEIEGTAFGDRVTLVGRDGKEEISIQILAELSERFNYEFACDISKRVPREYWRGGKRVAQIDYFA